MRIGILGGSFDPIHEGHLALAREARVALGLDRVLLVVAAAQPLKPAGALAGAEDRYAMVHLAAREEPWLTASDLELQRAGPSYTVETLRTLREEQGPGHEWVLVLGADTFADFARWRSAPEVDALAEVVAFSRPGASLPSVETLAAALGEERARALLAAVRPSGTPDVSSTEVRRRLGAGENVSGLVPENVLAYIRSRGLYKGAA